MEEQPFDIITGEEKTWGLLAHLLALIATFTVPVIGNIGAPLFIYLAYKERSRFVAFQALQSLFFQLVVVIAPTILGAVAVFLAFTLVGIPLAVLVGIAAGLVPLAALVYAAIACVHTYNGEWFEYWLVSRWARDILDF